MTSATNNNNIETEYLEITSKNEWSAFYQSIRAKSLKQSGSCTVAVKPQNKILNRYRDVSPFDHSRIILQRGYTDYINANLCMVEKANRKYILTQGPLSQTVSHFWLMIWEQESKAVLMLNKLVEKNMEKCSQYWPEKIGPNHKMTFNDVSLTLEYLEQQDHSYYLTRVLRLTDVESGNSRDILHFHYTTWPDFGVPCSPTKFLDFLRKVRSAGVLEDTVGPAVIHCSAGIGRSGTFCLVDSCLVLIEKFGLNSVSVEEVLLELRKYRMGLIQTAEQLRFSYLAIIEGAKQLSNPNSSNSTDDDSENVEQNHIDVNSKSSSCNNTTTTNSSSNKAANDDDDDDDDVQSSNSSSSSDEDDEPPPLPPPRNESLLHHNNADASTQNRPLPKIPNSVSDDDLMYKETDNNSIYQEKANIPSGPLPVVPAEDEDEVEECSSEDELEEEDDSETPDELNEDGKRQSESPTSEKSSEHDHTNSVNTSDVRHRKRAERKEQLEAQVRDMKRRQQINEQWTQLKRSLFLPLVLGGSLLIGSGILAYYFYYKRN